MNAIIQIQGKQFNVQKGDSILIPKLNQNLDSSFPIKNVLYFKNENQTLIGKPFLNNIQVDAKVLEPQLKSQKIIVFKYKKRKNYRRKYGHRTIFTKLLIENIALKSRSNYGS